MKRLSSISQLFTHGICYLPPHFILLTGCWCLTFSLFSSRSKKPVYQLNSIFFSNAVQHLHFVMVKPVKNQDLMIISIDAHKLEFLLKSTHLI